MTHSPEFIEEMKAALEGEKAQIEKELKHIAHKEHGDYTANSPEYERDEEVNANESADLAAREATTEAIEARLKDVDAALGRITAGTYGRTSEGKNIPEERLRANPAATTLIE